VTPEAIEAAIARQGWKSHYAGDDIAPEAPKGEPTSPGTEDPTIVLYDPDGIVVIGATTMIDFSKLGGDVTPGPHVWDGTEGTEGEPGTGDDCPPRALCG